MERRKRKRKEKKKEKNKIPGSMVQGPSSLRSYHPYLTLPSPNLPNLPQPPRPLTTSKMNQPAALSLSPSLSTSVTPVQPTTHHPTTNPSLTTHPYFAPCKLQIKNNAHMYYVGTLPNQPAQFGRTNNPPLPFPPPKVHFPPPQSVLPPQKKTKAPPPRGL